MGWPFGKANQGKTSTTPREMQWILGAQYDNQGVISGLHISPIPGTLRWAVSPGAAAVDTEIFNVSYTPKVIAAVTDTVELTIEPGGTTYRRDSVYVDPDGNVKLKKYHYPSAGEGALIGTIWVPAGAKTSSEMWVEENTQYALPPFAGRGMIAEWKEPAEQDKPANIPWYLAWKCDLNAFPTDRALEVVITQCLTTTNQEDPYDWKRGIYRHWLGLDGKKIFEVKLEYTDVYEPKQISKTFNVSGRDFHTLEYWKMHEWGETPLHFVTGADAGVKVYDMGGVQ